jgi:enamine deaminase RidA (YjgF/YER057c/UK114 family)
MSNDKRKISSPRVLQPPGWKSPKGYSNGVAARGEVIVIAGQVGWNEQEEFTSDDFADQAAQALKNIVAVLAEAGSRPEHLVRLTWYIADKHDYLASRKKLGDHYRQIIGDHFPAMSVLEVKGFIEDGARLEIEATAIVPDQAGVPLALGVGELQAKRWLSGCCR